MVNGGTATRVSDSVVYRHLWTAPELDGLFAERDRLQRWLDVLAALARAQATLGIIPAASILSMHGDAEFMPIDALGPAIQILFEALKETASR